VVQASREFQVFVKPAGAACNLGCRYCYYLEKEDLYPQGKPPRMPDDVLEQYIAQHIAASPGPVITFSWHGGEPTVVGLDYFRKIVAMQRELQPAGRRIANGLQTNGVLLDEEWGGFLAAEGFTVGLSLDGPQELHDLYRVTRGQEPTHERALRGYELLRRHRVPCDVLCVVHAQNAEHPTRVYRFFKQIGARYLGFLPLVERRPDAPGGVSERTVSGEALGRFLCTIFDEWRRWDVGRVRVQMFEEAARTAFGHEPGLCVFRSTCGDVPVVEHNGDFFSCDHFVDPEHRLGNIQETPLGELLESPAQRAFGQAKAETLPRQCLACEVRAMCHGGCPKDRFLRTTDGEEGLSYLCAGYRQFFNHCRPFVAELARLEHGRAVERPADPPPTRPRVGRNDPCPCGSGRKYKRCCAGKESGGASPGRAPSPGGG
jgi:uncharacterized protein